MNTVARFGIRVLARPGWEARLYRREPGPGETTHPILHVGTFPLPADRGDFGSGAVEIMGNDDVLVVLLEYHPDSAATALFRRAGMPRVLTVEDFSPTTLQRLVPGQAGAQLFFNEGDAPSASMSCSARSAAAPRSSRRSTSCWRRWRSTRREQLPVLWGV